MTPTRPREIAHGVYRLALPVSNAYLWDWGDGLTLIDTGIPGSADAILGAIGSLSRRPEDVHEIVLTHFHADHTGSVADLAQLTRASVLAHQADAPIIRGEPPPIPPQLTALERPLAEALFGDASSLPGAQPPPVAIDRELAGGETTQGGGRIVAVPGHTPGSIA